MPCYLIVGAGAVGQPLAAHLIAGGAEVSFLVKPKYAAELRAHPLTLHQLPAVKWHQDRRYEVQAQDYRVLTTIQEAEAHEWDAVILAVSSHALRQGQWLQDLVNKLVKPTAKTSLIFTTSSMCDRSFLLDDCEVPEGQLVQGGIFFLAWQAPLPAERFTPVPALERAGIAVKSAQVIGYMMPSFLLSGAEEHTSSLAIAFNAGGMNCRVVKEVKGYIAFLEAVLMPFLVLLEAERWSFERMKSCGHLSETAGAIRECLAVAQHESGPSFLFHLVSLFVMHRWFLWLILVVAPLVVPFDLEAYLKYHFSKVGKQTKQYIDEFVEHGNLHFGPKAMVRMRLLRQKNPRWK